MGGGEREREGGRGSGSQMGVCGLLPSPVDNFHSAAALQGAAPVATAAVVSGPILGRFDRYLPFNKKTISTQQMAVSGLLTSPVDNFHSAAAL